MFKKVVSQLSLSPATVEQVARYATVVRRKRQLHGWASLVLILLIILHVITLVTPPSLAGALPDATPVDTPHSTSFVHHHTADTTSVAAGQSLTWKLTLSNPQDASITEDVWFLASDATNYAEIISASDQGIISSDGSNILWPDVTLAAGETLTLTVTARIDPVISSNATPSDSPETYDCRITTTFGNTESVQVECPFVKRLETIFSNLPSLAPSVAIGIYSTLLILNLLTHGALWLQSKELRIIRTQLNTGVSL